MLQKGGSKRVKPTLQSLFKTMALLSIQTRVLYAKSNPEGWHQHVRQV